MKYTANYKLKKPEGTEIVGPEAFNDNADIIDIELKKMNDRTASINAESIKLSDGKTVDEKFIENTTNITENTNRITNLTDDLDEHKTKNITSHNVARGISTFVGNGKEVTIPHGLKVKPISAYAFPTINPEGYLGEVWIRMDKTNLYIGNSGSFTGAMSWTAIG